MPARPLARLLLSLSGIAVCSPAPAGDITFTGASGAHFAVPVLSYRDQQFYGIVKQRYDFSCGSAALATLLTYHHDTEVGEQAVFEKMYALGDQEKIRAQGFSMLDMKRYAAAHGLRADGLRMQLDDLQRAQVPGIALTTVNGYRHFVVIKGISATEVLVGDPALGLKTWPRAVFEASWNGVLFVIHDGKKLLGQDFNTGLAWHLRPNPPLGTAVNRANLADFSLALPRSTDY